MEAGRYRHRIALQRPVTTRGTSGGVLVFWELIAERWAAIVPIRGREYMAARQVQAEQITRFLLRYTTGLTPKDRLITQQWAFGLSSIIDLEDAHRDTEILGAADPHGPPEFQYGSIAVAAGPTPRTARITWYTDFYASTRIRYRKVGAPAWTETTEADLTERAVLHGVNTAVLDLASNYEAQIYSRNYADFTPGWAGALTWGIGAAGEFLPGGYIP